MNNNIKKGPWTIIDSKDIYKNPWIKVVEDKVIRPDGKEGIFGVVTMKPGVSVLSMDNEGNVFLISEYHYATENENIQVVSGGIDNGESKLEAAKRELKEEIGIEAGEWIDMGVVDPFTSVIKSPNYLFLAKNLTFLQANPEGTENIKVIKMPFKEAIKLVQDNKITHSASVILILKTKDYLNTLL